MQITIQQGITANVWYNGIVYIFEWCENGIQYLAASLTDDFDKAIVVACIEGSALKQLHELEQLVCVN